MASINSNVILLIVGLILLAYGIWQAKYAYKLYKNKLVPVMKPFLKALFNIIAGTMLGLYNGILVRKNRELQKNVPQLESPTMDSQANPKLKVRKQRRTIESCC